MMKAWKMMKKCTIGVAGAVACVVLGGAAGMVLQHHYEITDYILCLATRLLG